MMIIFHHATDGKGPRDKLNSSIDDRMNGFKPQFWRLHKIPRIFSHSCLSPNTSFVTTNSLLQNTACADCLQAIRTAELACHATVANSLYEYTDGQRYIDRAIIFN